MRYTASIFLKQVYMEHTSSKTHTTPKDFFLHLGVMAFLYAAAISLLTILYGIINFYFPDKVAYDYYFAGAASTINGGAAAFIVTFPVFLILARLTEADMSKYPQKRELWIRKWLVFLTIFVAGITMVVDLIALIRYFFEGELTMRFLVKVLVVFLTSGAVFSYFMYELKSAAHKRTRILWTLAVVSSGVALGVLCLSFTVIGSPFNQRSYKLDETRVQHLSDITQNIIYHRQNFGDIPEALNALEQNGFVVPRDPETGADYEFRRISDMKFELCATFNLPTRPIDVDARNRIQKPIPPGYSPGYESGHGIGRTCFERQIFPDQVRIQVPAEMAVPIPRKTVPVL